MKYLILITIFITLFASSCNPQLPDYSKAKKISLNEANAQLYQIRDDIKTKSDGFSVETKLNLVMTDFIFHYPDEYERLKELPLGFDKKHLLTNAHFVAICANRDLDTSEIEMYIYLPKTIEPNR